MNQPSEGQIDDALLRVFVDLGAGDGAALLLDDLRLEWSRMQLGTEQLPATLRGLVFKGWLEVQHTDAGPSLKLSPRARLRAKGLHPGLRSLLRGLAGAALTAAVPRVATVSHAAT